jgi:hypothetical protein
MPDSGGRLYALTGAGVSPEAALPWLSFFAAWQTDIMPSKIFILV